MPVFKVQAPDGTVIKVEAGDEATAIRGAQEHYASRRPPKPDTAKDVGKSLLGGLAEGAAQVGDLMLQASPVGAVRQALAGAATADGLVRGKAPSGPTNPLAAVSERTAPLIHQPETTAGKYARSVGNMAVNAFAPGGLARKAAAILVPGLTAEGAAHGAEAMGGNAFAQGAARVAGGLAGGVAAGVRRNAMAGSPVSQMPRQDANAMNQRAAEYRASGIEPTLVDVVDDSGRGAVRAAASRMTPARQRATEFTDARALDLPSRMGGQARRVMSQDPRTPDQIRTATAAQRRTNANANFGAVRGDTIPLAEETVAALRTDYGRRAIQEAASRERDPEVRAALNRLHGDAFDNPGGTEITIGMADRVSRVLNGQAQAAARSGDNELAGLLGDLAEGIRNPARQASPGYQSALEGYAADSRLQEAAGTGESLLTRNTDEFVEQAAGLSDEERALAQAAARRAIERKAGENVGSAPGVARQIANAPEQQARNAALLGPERATQLQDGMRLEERLVRNANDIAPRVGSQTQVRGQDAANMAAAAVRTGGQVARGDWIGVGVDWLRSRGMNDAQAEGLVNLATDPAQLDAALRLIAQRYGPDQAQQFLQLRQAALLGAAGGTIGARRSDTEAPTAPSQ